MVQNATFVIPMQTFASSSTGWLASDVVHDSCYVKQYKDKEVYNGYDAEMECMNYQLAFLIATNAPSYVIPYAKWIINTEMDWYSKT